ncbi:hypothetical protein ACS0TY_017662 [Phlomoides rotata]
MEKQQDLHSCLVVWRGRKIVVEVNSRATLKELGDKLQELTNVEAGTLRLLVPVERRSKLLYPFSDEHSVLSLESTSILKGKSIRMMGVPKDEVNEVLQNAKVDLRIVGFDEEEKRLKHRRGDRSYTSLKLPQGTYIFCDFRTLNLPGIELDPPASRALALLHKLASDPGIVAIMNKHRWRVGILTEMAPVGYVGVSPKCILGFNKNHGEEISLRLRTDDLKGFRKYESIKKTLLHELAHMVFSEHDSKFYALDSQLNKEAATLDWTKARGHTLGGVTHSQHYDEDFDASSNVTSSRKLGGQVSILSNARSASVTAAFERIANASTIIPRSSEELTTSPDPDVHCNQNASGPDPDEHLDIEMDPVHIRGPLPGMCEESNPNISGVTPVEPNFDGEFQRRVDILEPELDGSHAEEMQLEPESIPMRQNTGPNPDDPELQVIQDPVTVFCGRLQNAVQSLKYEATPTETGRVLQTLIKIIGNVIEHPDDMKFKKLRKANPMIQRNLIAFKAAVDILTLVGFCEDVSVDELGKAEVFLVLKRNDPGLLWLAKSSLETCIL